jgi:hypothetical protein
VSRCRPGTELRVEFIFQLLFEFLLQFLFEGAFDVMFGKVNVNRPLRRFFMFLFVGAVAGAVSLAFVREHFITHGPLRYTAVLIVPVVIGFLMAQIGKLKRKRGAEPNSLEYFFSSWGFAFAFGAIRVAFAK